MANRLANSPSTVDGTGTVHPQGVATSRTDGAGSVNVVL
jgi:hypothetical protein